MGAAILYEGLARCEGSGGLSREATAALVSILGRSRRVRAISCLPPAGQECGTRPASSAFEVLRRGLPEHSSSKAAAFVSCNSLRPIPTLLIGPERPAHLRTLLRGGGVYINGAQQSEDLLKAPASTIFGCAPGGEDGDAYGGRGSLVSLGKHAHYLFLWEADGQSLGGMAEEASV